MKGKRNAENGFQFGLTVFIMHRLMKSKWRYWFGLCWGRVNYLSEKLMQSLTVAILSALFIGIECNIND